MPPRTVSSDIIATCFMLMSLSPGMVARDVATILGANHMGNDSLTMDHAEKTSDESADKGFEERQQPSRRSWVLANFSNRMMQDIRWFIHAADNKCLSVRLSALLFRLNSH